MTGRFGAALAALLLAVGGWVAPVSAGPVVIDFEGWSDGEPLLGQYVGLVFTNTTAITAGLSLNETDYPPQSGSNVVFDDGAPLTILFSAPVTSVGGYFTYSVRLSLEVFDENNNPVGQISSVFDANFASGGDPTSAPNEFLELIWANGISSLRITGDSGGGSFTLDDLTFESAAPSGVPEPSSLALLAVGLLGLCRRRGTG